MARWLRAALEEPYAPQVEYTPVAAPEDVRIMRPLVLRRWGSEGLICFFESGKQRRGGKRRAYECNSTEEIHVVKGAPFFRCAVSYSLDWTESAVIYDQTIDSGE
jgi:hypothetical protein